MPWFNCDSCGDTVKKPKIDAHARSCAAESFTCIDCSCTFDYRGVKAHVSCVTEHEKYALAATKPGGAGARVNAARGGGGGGGGGTGAEAFGEEFLATGPPWKCACCNVTCTSQETLLGHAAGKKHKSKARGARARAGGGDGSAGDAKEEDEDTAKPESEQKKEKKEKRKSSADDSSKSKKLKK